MFYVIAPIALIWIGFGLDIAISRIRYEIRRR